MAVADFVMANPDRHIENWGFIVDNSTNDIVSFASLFDYNQCLISNELHTDLRDQIYEPTRKPFSQSIQLAGKGNIDWSVVPAGSLTSEAEERLGTVQEYPKEKTE